MSYTSELMSGSIALGEAIQARELGDAQTTSALADQAAALLTTEQQQLEIITKQINNTTDSDTLKKLETQYSMINTTWDTAYQATDGDAQKMQSATKMDTDNFSTAMTFAKTSSDLLNYTASKL